MKIINSVEELPENLIVALYGAGGVGEYFLQQIIDKRKDITVRFFIDDVRKSAFKNIPVTSLSDFSPDMVHKILITSTYWKDIIKRLDDNNIKNFIVMDPFYEPLKTETTVVAINDIEFIFYTPNKILRMTAGAFGNIEPGTLKWIDTFSENSVFFDIGASNGMFGIYAAVARKNNVVAFEPDAQNFAITEMNHFLNRERIMNPFMSFNIALSKNTSLGKLNSVNYIAGAHAKILEATNGREQHYLSKHDHAQYVLTWSLDEFIQKFNLPVPNYIKIDVDGAERAVVTGAENTLAKTDVKELLVEIADPYKSGNDVVKMIQKMGFKMREYHPIYEIIGSQVHNVFNCLFVK